MKILELTNYSSGICGVWQRVKQESLELSKKGHDVRVFSSNKVKSSEEIAPSHEKIEKIEITRFPAKKIGGESFLNWSFKKEAIIFKPDIIIAHSYRHPHTTKAIGIAKKINAKVFLVTHAPFGRKETRSFLSNQITYIYDKVVGPFILKKFNKVITITKWENKYLKNLGVRDEHISYIPNGIPEEFFNIPKEKEENKILFLGRVSPIKNLEVLIESMSKIKDKKIKLEIVGPAESEYLLKLKKQVKDSDLEKRIIFSKGIYDLNKKIEKIDASNIFVLPSKSEGMPQGLIEAMARERVVIASNNEAARELIKDKKNGFLFKIGDSEELSKSIDLILGKTNSKEIAEIRKLSKKSVEAFNWNNIIKKIEKTISM